MTDNTMTGVPIVDVYIQQLCRYANQMWWLVAPTRSMLMQPQTFYTIISPPGGEIAGSQELRGAGINAGEFAQLDYFLYQRCLIESSA